MAQDNYKGILAIHGGAGNIQRQNISPEKQKEYITKLTEALQAGYDTLQNGASSTDAIVTTIMVLENSRLFNAGKGSVFTNDETNEMDASIMDGDTKSAGAVAGIKTIKKPITAAQAVKDHSEHVMLSGDGADLFGKEQGLEIEESAYFADSNRLKHLIKLKAKEKSELDHDADDRGELPVDYDINDDKYGTVGAVALDRKGNVAAGTSTGGMTNKRWGRIGDSPIIGAGTYADNETCAISSTGHGEYFIRHVAAYRVAMLMELKKYSLDKAANEVVHKTLLSDGGRGGMVGIDRKGNISMPFNSPGMFRVYVTKKGEIKVFLFGDEK